MIKTINIYAATDNWLYREIDEPREFKKSVTATMPDAPLWHECTNEEKEQWEAEHPEPEPEVTEAEVVE